MKIATGMVAAIVKVPHALPLSAFTTTSPTTASRITMMMRTVTSAMKPPTLPISSRAILPSDLPSRRMEQKRMTKSLYGPSEDGADDDPQRAGQVAELRGQDRPTSGPGSGDCGEVVAQEDPLIGGLKIVAIAQALGGCGAAVVQGHHACRYESPVEAVGGDVSARRG